MKITYIVRNHNTGDQFEYVSIQFARKHFKNIENGELCKRTHQGFGFSIISIEIK